MQAREEREQEDGGWSTNVPVTMSFSWANKIVKLTYPISTPLWWNGAHSLVTKTLRFWPYTYLRKRIVFASQNCVSISYEVRMGINHTDKGLLYNLFKTKFGVAQTFYKTYLLK